MSDAPNFELTLEEFARLGNRIAELEAERDSIRDEALEEAMAKVRHDCTMCEGSGYADPTGEAECEYCGRPRAAIRALKGTKP